MNLHAIVSGAIGVVNPFVPIIIQRSIGYSTSPSGKRTPTYAFPQTVFAQVQALSASELQQVDALNIQGEKRAIYINGRTDGIIREDRKGGDLITLNAGSVNKFLGFLTSDQLIVDQVLSGALAVDQQILGPGVLPNTVITMDLTGGGGAGAYGISPSQTVPGPLLAAVGTDDSDIWLNVHVLEYWPDWCKFVITRQDGQ